MKKNVIIIVLSLLFVFLAIYSNIKANEASKLKLVALENQVIALENQAKQKVQEKKATKAAAIYAVVEQKVDELERALEVCK